MARVTVEDCVEIVPNRFELVVLASQRAKDISSGAALTVDRDNDKNAVVALREIADETINAQNLKEVVVQGLQRKVKTDKFEEEPVQEEGALDTIMQELESFHVKEDFDDDSGLSFEDENIDSED